MASAPVSRDTQPALPSSSALSVFLAFLSVGAQSFGGGGATMFLMRRESVERGGYLTDTEFTRYFALCQITPGLNLFALAILVGRHAAGVRGMIAALFGLLLPTVVITLVITMFYAHLRNIAVVQSALRGIVPATAGLGLLTGCQIASSTLKESRMESQEKAWANLLLPVLLILLSAAMVASRIVPVFVVLLAAGLIHALFSHLRHSSHSLPPDEEAEP